MRAVIQKVKKASVVINHHVHASIASGVLVLLGVEDADTDDDVAWLSAKISKLRIFDDDQGVMNKSVVDATGEILVVSQFTLHAATRKGNRPSYIRAAKPAFAVPMYEKFVSQIQQDSNLPVKTGVFGAKMDVALINDGPVTIIIDTKNKDF